MIRKDRLGYCLVIVVALTLLLELGAFSLLKWNESSLTKTSQRHIFSTYRGHKLNPEYIHQKDTGGKKLHSSDGFREADGINKIKSADTIRIIMFGGSAMYGLGVYSDNVDYQPALSSNETIDYFLEEMVNRELGEKLGGRTVEIINAGVSAYQTFQHLIYYNEKLHNYSPDLVIFFDGHNDFYISRKQHNHWEDYDYISTYLAHPINERSALLTSYVIARYLGKYSHFFSLVERYLSKKRLAAVRKISKRIERENLDWKSETFGEEYYSIARSTYLRVYEQFQALSDYDGFKMMIVLQPEIVFESVNNLGESDKRTFEVSIGAYGPGRIGTMKRIREVLEPLFEKHALDFVDLGEIGSESTLDKKLYGDRVHLAPKGAQRVAELLSEVIEKRFVEYGWIN